MTGDAKTDDEMRTLKFVLENEKGHLQWGKQAINLVLLFGLICLNLFTGSRNRDSLIGIETCSGLDYMVKGLFICLCIFGAYMAIKSNAGVQKMK